MILANSFQNLQAAQARHHHIKENQVMGHDSIEASVTPFLHPRLFERQSHADADGEEGDSRLASLSSTTRMVAGGRSEPAVVDRRCLSGVAHRGSSPKLRRCVNVGFQDRLNLREQLREFDRLSVIVSAAGGNGPFPVAGHGVSSQSDHGTLEPSSGSALIWRVASQPSSSGMFISIRIR